MNLVDFSDTQFLVPCKRCAELLQDGDRFCRFCGELQWDGAALVENAPGGQRDRKSLTLIAGGGAAGVAAEAPQRHWMVPTAWRMRKPPAGAEDVPPGWSRGGRGASPMLLGIATALLVIFGGVLAHDLWVERRNEGERLGQFNAKLDEMQRHLDAGAAAQQAPVQTEGNAVESPPPPPPQASAQAESLAPPAPPQTQAQAPVPPEALAPAAPKAEAPPLPVPVPQPEVKVATEAPAPQPPPVAAMPAADPPPAPVAASTPAPAPAPAAAPPEPANLPPGCSPALMAMALCGRP